MSEKQQILDAARRLEADPPRSKLDDYAEVIWELRRKRKRICSITAFLNQHGVRVGKSTVARWLKTHPVSKANASEKLAHSSTTQPSPQPVIDQAAHEFFTPSKPKHEDHEQEPRLWNRPD
jgi:hypothetical protein